MKRDDHRRDDDADDKYNRDDDDLREFQESRRLERDANTAIRVAEHRAAPLLKTTTASRGCWASTAGDVYAFLVFATRFYCVLFPLRRNRTFNSSATVCFSERDQNQGGGIGCLKETSSEVSSIRLP